jgi:type I restriction enzyme S subunit
MSAIPVGYKLSEVGVIPAAWNLAVLGEICTTSSGTTPARDLADRYFRNGTVNWVKTLDLNNSSVTGTDELVTPKAIEETCLRPYPPGTVLVAMYGGFNQIGRTGLLRITAAVNQAITAIQPRASVLNPEYLLATLNFKVEHWKAVASSSRKDPNITSQDIRAFPIALPPLPEQRAIAAALSDVDALLAKLDQFIAKKRDLKQAAMQQLLTGQTRLPGFRGEWEVKRLGELLAYEQPTKYLVSSSEYSDSNDVPVLTAGKTFVLGFTHETEGIFADLPTIIFDDFTTATKFVTFPFKAKSSAMKILKPRNPLVNLRLVYEIMQLIDFKLGDHKRYWISEYSKLEVKLPEVAEQTAIATVLSDMDAELAALEARRDKTRALKQGMMQELLTGRIRLV